MILSISRAIARSRSRNLPLTVSRKALNSTAQIPHILAQIVDALTDLG